MTKENFLKLIDKYLEGKASLQEEQQLLNFYESFAPLEEWDEKIFGVKEDLENKMLNRIQSAIKAVPKKATPISLWGRLAVAASFVLICATTFYFYKNKSDQLITTAKSSPILPGSNKAFLTLANGKKILLNAQANETLAAEGSKNAIVSGGKLIYTPSTGNTIAINQYNLIEVPKGGQYQVDLPDGSKVWLNAESSLYYPTDFLNQERKVVLTGEAYFEVAKDSQRPFKVESKQQQIEVLGTHFNVSAYPNDHETTTTLLEGKVRVSLNDKKEPDENSKAKILYPGQQATVTSSSDRSLSIKHKSVDVDEAVAWKNGNFIFPHEDIRSVMKKIERWYNVEIIFKGPVSDDLFFGTISRSKSLSSVLEKLELAGNVHFKIEERRVIVLP